MTSPIISRAPGKLILLGEYAVLEGAPALVAAVNRRAMATMQPVYGAEFRVEAPDIEISTISFRVDDAGEVYFASDVPAESLHKLHFFFAAFQTALRALKDYPQTFSPAAIALDTGNFFYQNRQTAGKSFKLGLGSSAALTVALLGAMLARAGKPPISRKERGELFRLGVQAHRAAQENLGSGIDVAASALGGVLKYQIPAGKPPEFALIEPLALPQNCHFRIVWSGKSASTTDLVKGVHCFRDKDPVGYQKIMAEMAELSSAGIAGLKKADTPAFLDAVREYCREMERLGQLSDAPILSPEHRRIGEIVRECGAAYKPSGAGGGALGIAFAASANILQECDVRLKKAGIECIDISIARKGIQIN